MLTPLKLNCLVNNGVLDSYAPLVDIKGSYSAQFEHVSLSMFLPRSSIANTDRPFLCEIRVRRSSAAASITKR